MLPFPASLHYAAKHLLLFLLACPPDDKEPTASDSGGSDSAENRESPPDTDCTAIEGYTDADGDGYGDPTQPHSGCVDDPLTVDNDRDCNDTVATIHPLAEERCDGVDQDCDSQIDENATDGQTYYADADGDGHGDPGQSIVACTTPSGSVENADDCDDSEELAWTGAAEICGDGVDQDCDPTSGACLVSGAQSLRSGDYLIQGAHTTDLAGSSVAALGDWDGDGTGDLLVGAPFTNAGGTVYVVPMANGTLGGQQVSWSGNAAADGLGTAVVALPDLDGDGRMELAATAPGGASLYGQVEVYNSHSGSPTPGEVWTGQELHGGFGSAVANLGDTDGNGIPTLAVGAYGYGYLSTFGGAVFLGETDGTDKNASDLVRMERATNTQTGSALANVGDVDGDGQDDLLVGSAPYNTALTAELLGW